MTLGRVIIAASRLRWSWLTIISSLVLTLVGAAAIDVASNGDGLMAGLAGRHLAFAAIGAGIGLILACIDLRITGFLSIGAYVAMIAVLLILIVPGIPPSLVRPQYGARSWINVGAMTVQPSEFAKVITVLALAMYLRTRDSHRTLAGFIPPAIIVAIPVGLILLQPDLGTASLFVPAFFAMLVAAGARFRHLSLIVLCAIVAAPAAYPLLRPHQKERIVGLIHQFKGDERSDLDVNFQAITARTLIGAGGIAGHSRERTESLLRFNPLPKSHNDMIFAVLVNRWGLLGGLLVVGLYVVWVAGALATAAMSREGIGRVAPVGFAAFVVVQACITIGMNAGILPIIGVTLPFVSAGGSSLIACWVMVGIVVSAAARTDGGPRRPAFDYAPDR